MPDVWHVCKTVPCPYCGRLWVERYYSRPVIQETNRPNRSSPESNSQTVILNHTTQSIDVPNRVTAASSSCPPILPKGSWTLEYSSEEGYNQFEFAPNAILDGCEPVILTTDDLRIASVITIYETRQNVLEWRISSARDSAPSDSPKLQELATFNAMVADAHKKMALILKVSESLENLSEQAKICRAQCTNLVKKYVEGTMKMKETYFDPLMENETNKWLLYNSHKLKQLLSSLDNLLSTLGYAKDLVQDCGKDWIRMALSLSIPMKPPGKNPQYSRFSYLLDELSWNLDKIQYILLFVTGDAELKWSETRCRYALGPPKSVLDVAAAEMTEQAECSRLVLTDRKAFLSLRLGSSEMKLLQEICNLRVSGPSESGEEVVKDSKISEVTVALPEKRSQEIVEPEDKIAAVVKKRLQEVNLYVPIDCCSLPGCFWINYQDLVFEERLSHGEGYKPGFKSIYIGKWLGQKVAIGIVENSKEVIEKEALIMLKVQHPNIVHFLGCAFTDKALVYRHGLEEVIEVGCLVMEYMPEDLWKLRIRWAKGEGSFHPAVVVDILLQIVEAMIHMHNLGIIHRDLKAANCLVRPRVMSPNDSPESSNSQSLCFYTVKVIDFGTSKVFDDAVGAKHTLNQGTRRWMAPEVWGPPGFGKAEYTKKADVFSFGMTCYEVVTGLMPFYEYLCAKDILVALNDGKRPSFPASVSCPEGLKLRIADCWAQEPNDRPTFEEIRKDLWTIKYELEFQ